MLEINCSYWIDNCDLTNFSNSIANSGDPDIGSHTWENACEEILEGYKSKDASRQIVTSTASRRMLIKYFREFGAWTYTELFEMTNIELSAMALQYIAGNYIEDMSADDDLDSDDYESGYFFRYQGDIWITLSN